MLFYLNRPLTPAALRQAYQRVMRQEIVAVGGQVLPGKEQQKAKQHLRRSGWSYRSAAPVLGVTYVHLCLVLTGRRESRRLMDAIFALPSRPGPGWNCRRSTATPATEVK